MKNDGTYPAGIEKEVADALAKTEEAMGMKYGRPGQPAVGLLPQRCPQVDARHDGDGPERRPLLGHHPGLVKKTGNERFVFDAYRRLITMYSDVVMEKSEGIEPAEGWAFACSSRS